MRRKNQTAKAATGENAWEQMLIAEYGADYHPGTKEAFEHFFYLRSLFAAWDDREDAAKFKKRWAHKWPNKAALKAAIEDAKEIALSDFYSAFKSGNGGFLRAFATAVEADKARWASHPIDRHRYWIVSLFKDPFAVGAPKGIYTVLQIKIAIDRLLGGDIDIRQVRKYCAELEIPIKAAERGRPKNKSDH